jgi:hypothetical protein
MRVRSDDRIRPIWTVTAQIRGSEYPEDVVVVAIIAMRDLRRRRPVEWIGGAHGAARSLGD